MLTGRLTERATARLNSAFYSVLTAAVVGGLLIGVMAPSVWFSWTVTWGDDWAFSVSAITMLCAGLILGERLQLCRLFGWTELAIAACTWTLLLPWLSPCLIVHLRFLPVELLGPIFNRFLLGLVCGVPVWFVIGILWFGLVDAISRSAISLPSSPLSSTAGVAFGAGVGLGLSTFFVAPWIGAWNAVLIAIVLQVAFKFLPASWKLSPDGAASQRGTGSASIVRKSPLASLEQLQAGSALHETIRICATVTMGGLLAAVMRLVGQLVPGGCQFLGAEWIGLLIGFGVGGLMFDRRNRTGRNPANSTAWSTLLIPTAMSVLILAIFPSLINLSLSATASLTSVFLLMAFRLSLLAMATAPIGWAVACLTLTGDVKPSDTEQGTNRRSSSIWLSLVFAMGYVIAASMLSVIDTVTILSVCSLALVGLAFSVVARSRQKTTRSAWVGLGCLSLFCVSAPLWHAHNDPSRLAKLLFSTPSFVAHRAGWDSQLLPMLDDARAIDQRLGGRGSWTLWRSHGLELHLRENSIPRAVVSANTETYPQFPPSVLQAVFPLAIVDHPERVMVLGVGGGVSVETCLQFPVREVVCVEPDSVLIDLLRGSVARETGRDPFFDERTRLVAVPASLALMAGRETYDVILSSPPSAAVTAGAASFTVDYYQLASRHLADGGIFSQRFESIDYGPEPLQIVVQSMRQAFRQVIAIETGAGEMLLLATNTDGVFVPDDLVARLQMAHVRRVLASSGLDWSTLLNFPAYDHRALAEICASGVPMNTPARGLLALRAPLELMRWGDKLRETQKMLTADRTTVSPFAKPEPPIDQETEVVNHSRKSRLLEWLGDDRVSPEVLRRLAEVAAQRKLAQENPEAELHWWEYRKALKQQLVERPLNRVKQVAHTEEEVPLTPEDEHRKQYFVALGQAQTKPTTEHIAALESFLQPYDPLISFFARHEIAEIHSRSRLDPAAELIHRLHVIYFAPSTDATTRIISSTLELVVREPQIVPNEARRFDIMNGLIQTLRSRWEARQGFHVKSSRMQLTDVDRTVVAIEKAMSAMEKLYPEAGLSESDWRTRRQIVDRILTRPLRAYRTQLQDGMSRSEAKTRSMIEVDQPK